MSAEVRRRIADPTNKQSLGSRMRARRWERLYEHFPDLADMRVLDLGGTVDHWRGLPVRPSHLTIVNVHGQSCDDPAVEVLVDDACAIEEVVADRQFDLVYTNSVIEHVGGHARRIRFAENVRSLAPRHWVQTPYRYFPIEPHWLFPGFQFLPVSQRVWITERWPLGFNQQKGEEALAEVLNTELIDRTEMRYLFPDSELFFERVAGVPKSMISVATGS